MRVRFGPAHQMASRRCAMMQTWRPRQTSAQDGNPLRAMFLSDVHLATRACRADALLEFLRAHEAQTIYLVGDIVDFWRIRRGAIWPRSHSDILQALLDKMHNRSEERRVGKEGRSR